MPRLYIRSRYLHPNSFFCIWRLSGMAWWRTRQDLRKWLRLRNPLARECLAEFLGVFVLIVSKEESFMGNQSNIKR
ncbi:hypothetical protein XELAEV_18003315mg [Xenopus laevis]|uniref:Uncharacterized protein n=1 Tax=Xenopus laevis TaxID=8355 RepID=A0A974BPV4_XENLA|nr:hypothetical protein XELAEV_18003315mg [Xenopus laevis]